MGRRTQNSIPNRIRSESVRRNQEAMKPYYQDNAVVIYHGDCRDILPQLPKVDLVLTDPPYGLGEMLRAGPCTEWSKQFEYAPGWDKLVPELPELLGITANTEASFIIWGGNYYELPPMRGWLVWDKMQEHTSGHCELAWTNIDQPVRRFNYSRGQLASELKRHPTQKPLPLMTWCITLAGDVDTILDPFMGSGTTLRAAKDLGRRAIGIEIDEKYCEIAAMRMTQEVLPLSENVAADIAARNLLPHPI